MLKLVITTFFVAAVAASGIRGTEEVNSELDSSITDRQLASLSTITKLVKNNHRLDTLQAALEAAGLDDTLAGNGPFTLFAPTDAAFAKLGEETIEALLKDTDTLSDILLYHVVSGKVLKKNMKTDVIKAANGDNLRVRVFDNDDVALNGKVDVTTFNIMASNGVIHIIDEVLIPPKNVYDTIKGIPRFSTLKAAIDAAGLASTLKSMSSEFTIFAPNNKAFAALGQATIDALLKDPETLKSILLYHAVSGSVLRGDLLGSGSVKTAQGKSVKYKTTKGQLIINTSKVLSANILAANGMVHELNKVLTIPN